MGTTSNAFVEFQVVILTSDDGYMCEHLYNHKCKALMPVGNRYLIYHMLQNIFKQNLKYVTILVNSIYYKELQEYINQAFPETFISLENNSNTNRCIEIVSYECNSNEEQFTMHTLLKLKNYIKRDFIVASCDIFGFIDFHSLANLFRGENAMCAVLLVEQEEDEEQSGGKPIQKHKPINKGLWYIDKEYVKTQNTAWVCIDKNSRIVAIKPVDKIILNKKFHISKLNMLRHQNFILKTNLMDCHVYIFKNYVFDIMEEKKNKFTSIKNDLIPYLVRIQNSPKVLKYKKSPPFFAFTEMIEEIEKIKSSKENGKHINILNILENEHIEGVVCYVQPKKAGLCHRINNFTNLYITNALYCVPRQEMLKHILPPFYLFSLSEKIESFEDSLIGKDFTYDPTSKIRHSVIGNKVKVKEKCKISRSTLMDNVVVQENCTISDSVISNNVIIESDCTLINCVVKTNSIIPKNSHYREKAL